MNLAQQISIWADRLRDLSAFGLHFSQDIYDRTRYQAIQEIAIEMFALAGGELPEQLEPLRSSLLSHPTPYSVGDAAVIDQDGRILLIQRADNRKWAMPGGALEVGETPAQGVEREAFEETGVKCRATALVGVFDSRFSGSLSRHHLYHFMFLCQPVGAQMKASHANEVIQTGWFTEDELPEDLDPGHAARIPHAYRAWRGDERAFFDS
jgi:ADP-ribose pyrophosphatase YjhB (NUDIX family)